MRSSSKRSNMTIRSIAAACGEKWPAVMRVPIAAAYVGMTETRFRKTPQLSACIRIVWGMEAVLLRDMDAVIESIPALEEVEQ